ncbi:MAG TPA: sulfatase-like hydrolase/transferase [Polyangiaceae bacterium]|jgi:phosphoglycerol transferase MdoB-like AlkP superfamily enzyme|nr:sulfatase-like hydrolase/transferase [Polyangiaceae bacterium]
MRAHAWDFVQRARRLVSDAAPQRFPLGLDGPSVLASAVLIAYFIADYRKEGIDSPPLTFRGLCEYGFSLLSINLLLYAQRTLLRTTKLRVTALLSSSAVVVLLLGYRYFRMVPLDYQTVRTNITNGMGPGNLSVLYDSFGGVTFLIALLVLLAQAALEWRYRIWPWQHEPVSSRPGGWGTLALWAGLVITPIDTQDPVVYLARTTLENLRDGPVVVIAPGDYPYVRREPVRAALDKRPPAVFLVMMESFNARYVGATNAQGQPVMPVFQSLIPKGAYFDWFYGNSIQTSKGHASMLLSIVPSTRGKILVDYGTNCFHSIAEILREQGYGTLFYQAYANTGYEHGDAFYSRNGFERVLSAADSHGAAAADEAWGWGLRDEVFYRELFLEMDRTHERDANRSMFVAVAPVSNHAPFDKVPPHLRQMYPDPQDRHEHYANSIHLSDSALTVFFDELAKRPYLQDSLVILTGDHSFPTGEHGYTSNVSSFYEEFFRVPLLVLWPGHVAPARSGIPHSQLDIAPTLLDLLQIGGIQDHFLGHSLLAEASASTRPQFSDDRVTKPEPLTDPFDTGAEPIYLVQPYSGRYRAIVMAPYKLVFHERTERRWLFNVRRDPDETHDLAAEPAYASVLDAISQHLQQFGLNEQLLLQNQVWPCSK